MDTEITVETVIYRVSQFWPYPSEVHHFSIRKTSRFVCVQTCTGVYADVGPVTPTSVHLFYKWYSYQALCCCWAEQTEMVPVHSSAPGKMVRQL